MSISNGHFIPPMEGYGRPSPPTARRRMSPPESAEPDRAFAENAPANEPTLTSRPEPPKAAAEVAAKKKKRSRLSDEQKGIAVARVESLVGAGEELQKACASVGKEFGSSPASVKQWVYSARKAKPPKPRAAKKVAAKKVAPASNGSPAVHHLAQVDVLAEQLIMSIGGLVRTIVREEIRRMLS